MSKYNSVESKRRYAEKNKVAIYARNKARRDKKLELLAGRPKPATCEICDQGGIICWDHDHLTGKFRGWLCLNCNAAIGQAKESPIILQKLIQYLKTFNE